MKTRNDLKKYLREWHKKHPDKAKLYWKTRYSKYKKEENERKRIFWIKNRSRLIKKQRLSRLKPEVKEKLRSYFKKYYSNPENVRKGKARSKVWYAIRGGRLFKAPCHCGSTKVEAHHTDYTQPLKVKWLCRTHHIEADKKLKQRNENTQILGK